MWFPYSDCDQKLSKFTGDRKILTLNAAIMRSLRVLAWSRSVWKIISNSNISVHVFIKTELGKKWTLYVKTMGTCFLYLIASKGEICERKRLSGYIACKQALHLGELREVTREQHAKGDVPSRLALLIKGELASRLAATVQVTSCFPLS